MARPRIPLLSRDRIVERALAIVDADGAAALSTRRLARELGVSGPAFYSHFATMDELLDAVSERVASEVRHVHGETWQEVLRDFAWSYRRVMAAHPNAVSFMALRPVHHKTALWSYEWQLRHLTQLGWELEFAWEAIMGIDALVLGAALQVGGPPLRIEQPDARADYPLLAAVTDAEPPDGSFDAEFESVLEHLILGIEQRLATGSATARRPSGRGRRARLARTDDRPRLPRPPDRGSR